MHHREPWMLNSMDELLSQARAMEQEAIAGYHKLAERMRQANRPDLTAVFEALIREEEGHLGNVEHWIQKNTAVAVLDQPSPMFDDEGTAFIAPELLDTYRAFAMAVRNEERAFVFWSYVSAHAASADMKTAAERMAREELGHVATLRRERRRAFHYLKTKTVPGNQDISALEMRLAHHLGDLAHQTAIENGEVLATLAQRARHRAGQAEQEPSRSPFQDRTGAPDLGLESNASLAEWLLDHYLDSADSAASELARATAQANAADLVETLYVIRDPRTAGAL